MDDEDSKARRNFLFASTVILLAFWLDLPQGVIVKRVLGEEAAGVVNDLRVWAATLVLLVYLALRYRFSGSGQVAAEMVRNEWRTNVGRHITRLVRAEVAAWLPGGPAGPVFGDALATVHAEVNLNFTKTAHQYKMLPDEVEPAHPSHRWSSGATLTLSLDGNPRAGRINRNAAFCVRGPLKWVVILKSLAKTLAYSTASTEVLAPAVVGIGAFSVTLYRLGTALVTSYPFLANAA